MTPWIGRDFLARRPGFGREVFKALLAFNFFVYATTAGLAGWSLTMAIDSKSGNFGNRATYIFLPIVLTAAVVGVASAFAGIYHYDIWRQDSLAAATSTSLIALFLTLLAFGVAVKEIYIGGRRPLALIVAEYFTGGLVVSKLVYMVSLHASFLGRHFGPTYSNPTGGGINLGLMHAEKHHHGTPAATAV